jgi:pimeloyl-ACP methyl ester carboxylesterase
VTTTATKPTTRTLDVPGATLTYDVRRNDTSTEPILFLIGEPMGASGFGTLAGHLTDRTVMTYDPRGVEHSEKTDPTSPSTPDDVHRLIQAIGGGPVDMFASSGGAVNALGLAAKHPQDIRTCATASAREWRTSSPSVATIRAAPTRVVICAGAESEGELTHRAALAVAEHLDTEAVISPSHHGGFLGGEYGYAGEPDAFAAKVREVLASSA